MQKSWMNLKSHLSPKSNPSQLNLFGFTPIVFIVGISTLSLVAILVFARQGTLCRFEILLDNDGGRITIEGGEERSEGCKK